MHIRTYNVLRLLSREFDVTALCFYRAADQASPEEIQRSLKGLQHLAHVESFPIPQEHSKSRLILDHVRSLVTKRAYTVWAYESSDFRKRLKQLTETGQFQLAHLDSLDLAGYLPLLAGLPVVCVHHNVESALLRSRAATTGGLAGQYIALQARLTEIEERRWCPSVSLNIAVSDADRHAFKRIAPSAPFVVIPNGVDTQTFQRTDASEEGIVFVGAYSWQPNRDAMEYFCSEVLPLLRARGIGSDVTWVGRAPDAVKRDYAERYGLRVTGYLHDIRPVVQRAACYVVPLRAGGGTRLKILDAWAMGKAVVSTTVGSEGLDAHDGENILIRDTPEAFADAVAAVLTDEDLRRRLGRHARKTAELVYDWEVIGRSMLACYHQLLGLAEDSPGGDDNRRPQQESHARYVGNGN
ncbi:MAG: glycosyltransferase family 4 protein [Gemmatimonadota bacterium]|nr:glycosyltransferase family 4 protein [Gemmatimonadota bacterium]